MEQGFGFYWHPYKEPVIVHPDTKTIIKCAVQDYVPYVVEADGVVCPLAAEQPTISTSSSSRDPPRDESQLQSAKNSPALANGSIIEPGHEEQPPTENKVTKVNKDDVPLLEIEATSDYHLLTHTPKNPYCQSCIRAKMQRKPHRKKKVPLAERAEAENFGDLVTGDHIVSLGQVDVSVDGKRDAVVLYDVASGYLECFPTVTKNADETIQAIQHFTGPKHGIAHFHTDVASELIAAAKALGLSKGLGTPGVKETNGLAESKVRKVLEAARATMDHAGLPPDYWSYASRHYCFCYNHSKRYVNGEELPPPILSKKLPDGFSIPALYPFGCLVEFLPSPAILRKFPKWGTKSQPGVLLNYGTQPGGIWKKDYQVAILADFQAGVKRPQVHTIMEVTVNKNAEGEYTFPLKDRYEKLRTTVPIKSDKHIPIEEQGGEDNKEIENPFELPDVIKVSDENKDMSLQPIPIDSGPTRDEGTTDDPPPAAETSENSAEPKGEAETKEKIGYDESYGMFTRKKKGSQRPPDIPGVVWQSFHRNQKPSQ